LNIQNYRKLLVLEGTNEAKDVEKVPGMGSGGTSELLSPFFYLVATGKVLFFARYATNQVTA
jgi:hypothetical protein